MAEVTNELLYEVLKQLQTDMSEVKKTLSDQGYQLIRIREEINTLRGDDLRREGIQAQMDHRLERIEKRLGLVDA
jgi:hypothetical protein